MNGTLINKNQEWVVEFHIKVNGEIIGTEILSLHPDDVKTIEDCFTSKFSKSVKFIKERYCKKHNSDPSKNSVCTMDCGYEEVSYAKLIEPIVVKEDEEYSHIPIEHRLATEWVFETNGDKWSSNDDTAGDNYGSFIEGYNKAMETLYKDSWAGAWESGYKRGFGNAKETLYTIKELTTAMKYASEITNNKTKYMEDYILTLNESKK